MRVLALHSDLIVFISAFWQTTCTAVRGGEEGFVIDSPVLPHELEAIPQVLEQSRFPVSGLLVTHGDWDHLLGSQAFPGTSIGAGERTAALLAADPSTPQRELREFDEEHYVDRAAPLALEPMQSLPVPGRLELGDSGKELELHPTPGHTADGTAYLAPWLGVLICGDYLSPVEIPWISPGGGVEAYIETLGRLRTLVERCGTVIPGHGAPQSQAEAMQILEDDLEYLRAVATAGAEAPLPAGRQTSAQRRIHEGNAARAAG
jgi:glyoxylase-like metal-dependent hydrolase (beta-lactamase superfamily II)